MFRVVLLAMLLISMSQSGRAAEGDAYSQCLLQKMALSFNDSLTVGELKQQCQEQLSEIPLIAADEPAQLQLDAPLPMPAGIRNFFTPYKQNYILFGSMQNKDGGEPFSGKTLDIRFEFGMKFQLFQNREQFDRLSPLYFGFSQKSWWDIAESSAPFKEHNYNPEIFWDFEEANAEEAYLPYDLSRFVDRIGFEHQSNGLDGLASRSWDRVYVQKTFDFPQQDLSLKLKAWNVVNLGIENADITDYLGNVEATFSYTPGDKWEINASAVKGHHTSKYSYRVDAIRSMSDWLNTKFMLSYYDGFGEALISYNEKTQSLRAGIFIPLQF